MLKIATMLRRRAVLIMTFGFLLFVVPYCRAAGDFNGDGKDDIITFIRDSYAGSGQGDVYVALSSGSGFAAGSLWHANFCTGLQIPAVGDFNGDGKDDAVTFFRDSGPDWRQGDVDVVLSQGSHFWLATKWHDFFCVGNEIPDVGDFDGNGKDDIITFIRDTQGDPGRGDVHVALSNGSTFVTAGAWHGFFCIGNEIPAVGDFNGDGKDDIITFIRETNTDPWRGDVVVALSTGSSFGASQIWHEFFCIGNEIPVVGDFNGDGKDDIATFVRTVGTGGAEEEDVYVALSTGSSFSGTGVKWNEGFGRRNWIPDSGDFTGDGRDDVCCFLHDTSATYQRGDVRVARSTGTRFEYAGVLLGKWHDYFCVLDEVPTTFAAVFPYYMFNSSFENANAVFSCYPTNEEPRFNTKTSRFKHEFEDVWPCAQYFWAYPNLLREDHLYAADAVDLAYVTGHGWPGGIRLSWQDCWLTDCAWGSWSSNTRRGDLEYIFFESCQVTSLDGDWAGRWMATPNRKRPFSGLHVACGFWNNHRAAVDFSLADEVAENLEAGYSVRSAWTEAVDDENDWIWGHWNKASVIYLAPHKDESIQGHTNCDFWYHNPEYVMEAVYLVD